MDDNSDSTRLFYAIRSGDVSTLRHLIDAGCDVNNTYSSMIGQAHLGLLHFCCHGGKYECAKLLLQAGELI